MKNKILATAIIGSGLFLNNYSINKPENPIGTATGITIKNAFSLTDMKKTHLINPDSLCYEFIKNCLDFLKTPDPKKVKWVSFVLSKNDWSQNVSYAEGKITVANILIIDNTKNKDGWAQGLKGEGIAYQSKNRHFVGFESKPFNPGITEKYIFKLNVSQSKSEILVDGVRISKPQFLPSYDLVGNIFGCVFYGIEEIPVGYNDMGGSKPYRFSVWTISLKKESMENPQISVK